MRTVHATSNSVTVELASWELATLNNALNEAINGPDAIEEREFHTRIGVEMSEARTLLAELHSALG
jgi:hypothetical protein